MFCQITVDEEQRMSWHIVMVQHKSGFPTVQVSSCAQHPSNMLNFLVQQFVYHLTTWYKFMMDNAIPIKKHNQHHLDL